MPELGEIRVDPETWTVAVFRNGHALTGPMWFLVPRDDDCRWARAGEYVDITYSWRNPVADESSTEDRACGETIARAVAERKYLNG